MISLFIITNFCIFLSLFFIINGYHMKSNLHSRYVLSNEFSLNKFSILFLMLIFFYFAFRDVNLGSDYREYVAMYNNLELDINSRLVNKEAEYLFTYMTKLFAKLNIPHEVYFGFLSALTFLFILKSSYKFTFLLPLIIFATFSNGFFFAIHSNIRQGMAMAIFLYSIKFIIEGKPWKYLSVIFIASLIHQSALILIPIYFLRAIKLNSFIMLFLFIISLNSYFKDSMNQLITSVLYGVFSISDLFSMYSHYLDTSRINKNMNGLNTGIGFIIINLTNLYILLKTKKVISIQPNLTIYYTVFFIGVILFNLFWDNVLLQRANGYFLITFLITFSATIYYSTTKMEKFISANLILLYFIIFQASIYRIYQYI